MDDHDPTRFNAERAKQMAQAAPAIGTSEAQELLMKLGDHCLLLYRCFSCARALYIARTGKPPKVEYEKVDLSRKPGALEDLRRWIEACERAQRQVTAVLAQLEAVEAEAKEKSDAA